MDFSEIFVVCDIKIRRAIQLNEYMNRLNIKGQGHSLTFVQGHSDLTFLNFKFNIFKLRLLRNR